MSIYCDINASKYRCFGLSGYPAFGFLSEMVAFDLTDCQMHGPKKKHARPGAMKILVMRGKRAKKNPTRTKADPDPKEVKKIAHFSGPQLRSKIVFDFWPSSLSIEIEQALSSVVSGC